MTTGFKIGSIFFFPLVLLSHDMAGQNLVPNSSFESIVSCPTTHDISNAIGWMNADYQRSPDYYNTCSPNANGAPNNWVGYQHPFDGNGYAGVITWFAYQQPSLREAIEAQLIQALIPGVKYYVSAYISRAEKPTFTWTPCSSDNFGFRFSVAKFDSLNPVPIDNFSHVHSNLIVKDTASWTKISGSFIADSAYQFLTIGNFYDDTITQAWGCSNQTPWSCAYYFVDRVCVSKDSVCSEVTGTPAGTVTPIAISYPNPFSEHTIISFDNFSNSLFNFILYSPSGQIIRKVENIRDSVVKFKRGNLPEGIYFFQLMSGEDGSVLNGKLVVEK